MARCVVVGMALVLGAGGLAGGLAGVARAQDLTVKAPAQTTPIVLENITVHTVTGPVIERGAVLFRDGFITAVAPMSELPAIEASLNLSPTRIDASGLHAYPGLISAWTQLGLTEIQAVPAGNDTSETGSVTPEVRAIVAVNPDSVLIPVTRRSGILTAAVAPEGGRIAGQPSLMRLDGWTNEDLTIVPSLGVAMTWPGVRVINAWWMDTSEDEQRKQIRENLREIERLFDTAQAYHAARTADESTPIDLRWEAMRALFDKEGTAKLFIRAQDADQIAGAVTFAAQRGVRCVIVGGRDAPAVSELLLKHSVPVILQGGQNLPRRDDSPIDDGMSLAKRCIDAGLLVALAHNDDTAHERNLPYVAASQAAYGLSREDALKLLTINPAQILGVTRELGSLEAGKRATLIVTTGDPLEVTTDLVMAFIDGRRIDLSSKHTELAEKYLERYRQRGDLR